MLTMLLSAPVNGTDSVDDLLAWQFVTIGDLGVACVATVKCLAFVQEFSASCAVNGAVNTAAA